ncbi:hypothetical protein ACLMJK_005395 [Lecanora helva]
MSSAINNRGFPTFCATIVGGYSFLQILLRLLCDRICHSDWRGYGNLSFINTTRLLVTRFLGAFLSAWFGLHIFNASRITSISRRPAHKEAKDGFDNSNAADDTEITRLQARSVGNDDQLSSQVAGKTLDLTVLVSLRALDTVICNIWRNSEIFNLRPSLKSAISRHADTVIFTLSSGTIMWAWFFLPDRLPRTYNQWIGQAAQVDPRLIETLREARAGRFVYGKDGRPDKVLQDMCKDYHWPLEWGDPQKTIPVPCKVVHMGTGSSCHWHAIVRFFRAFKFALATNLPLQLVIKARKPSLRALWKACREAVRSSAFLGAFVGLFYYGVCLSRTCLGPKLFSPKTVSAMDWDSGLCVGAGCMLCGWSVLVEAAKRRSELALFVAPRAVASFLPREYDAKYLWREKAAFSLGLAVLFTAAQDDPGRVRGVLGRLLHNVLQ